MDKETPRKSYSQDLSGGKGPGVKVKYSESCGQGIVGLCNLSSSNKFIESLYDRALRPPNAITIQLKDHNSV